jgi:hypothetical protein
MLSRIGRSSLDGCYGIASGQKSSASTCSIGQGQASGNVAKGRTVSTVARRRVWRCLSPKNPGTWFARLGFSRKSLARRCLTWSRLFSQLRPRRSG